MAGKQVAGTGLSESIAGMSKNQLHDIMSQMKTLIEQNQQQAKQILIKNPALTKALFQAQIMLEMVRPPQVIPSVQPSAPQHSQPSTQTTQQPNIQQTQTSASQISLQEPTGAPPLAPPIKQYQNQPSITTLPTGNIQPQSAPLIPLQTLQHPKGFEMPQANSISVSQPSQIPSVPPVPPSAAQPPLLHQPPMSSASMQLQQLLQTAEIPHLPLQIPHLPLQAPLPPHSRAPTGPNFRQHYPPQTGHNMNYQPAQPMFHSGSKFPPGIGNSFPQGQSPLPSQPPPQSLYQAGGSKVGTEVMNQVGTSKPVDRGPWMHGPPENPTLPQKLSGPPLIPSGTGQMGPGNQPRPAPPLSQEMEKMLLQQVMSLTPEQINLLPPEQRSQVHQLQKMLRQ